MEGGDDGPAVHVEPLAAHAADGDLTVQDDSGGEIAEGHDHSRTDVVQLAGEERAAGLDLVRERIAVPGRAAFHHVGDVDVLATEPDLAEQLGEELSGRTHERLPLLVLVVARSPPRDNP